MLSKKLKILIFLILFGLLTINGLGGFAFGHLSSNRNTLFIGSGFLAIACGLVFWVFLAISRFYERQATEARHIQTEQLLQLQSIADLRLKAIESLAVAIDAKDQTTHGHVRRTQVYAVELGKLLNASSYEIEALRAGALLHDIGKLAVPDYILNKPGKLTAVEFEKMKVHAAVGADIVRRVNFPYPVEDVVRFHHEKWDGTGYPVGLKAAQIPLVARIISVVDFYDSTRCNRPYRAGMLRDDSLELLRRMAGKSFDPVVVEKFVNEIGRLDELIEESDLAEQIQSDEIKLHVNEGDTDASKLSLQAFEDSTSGFRSIAEVQREVSALHEMAQAIGSSLNLRDTVSLVTAKLRAVVPFDTCIVYALDEKTERAEPVLACGRHEDFFSKRGIGVGEGITGWVIANARSMFGTPPDLDMVGVPSEIASTIKSAICSPLMREDGSFGSITLYSTEGVAFTSEHSRLLETVCLHASSAINNALMFERTKQSALTDSLTGLPNARALQLLLEQRVAECRRLNGETLAVLSIDVNDFKLVNEELGHGIGDRLLASAADVIKSQLRDMDMLARYAGDEFIAVLPAASPEDAVMVSERIRTAVAAHKFQFKPGRTIRIEISVGISCFAADGDTADELILSATQTMKRKKSALNYSSDSSASAKILNIEAYK